MIVVDDLDDALAFFELFGVHVGTRTDFTDAALLPKTGRALGIDVRS